MIEDNKTYSNIILGYILMIYCFHSIYMDYIDIRVE